MKVKELIEKLQQFNPETEVCGYITDYFDTPHVMDRIEVNKSIGKNPVYLDFGNQTCSFAAGYYLYSEDPLFINKTKQLLDDFNRIYLNTGGSNRYILTFRNLEEDLTEVQNTVKSIVDGWKTTYTNPNKYDSI